jgi:GNAT superfamily N-acetyltransferase
MWGTAPARPRYWREPARGVWYEPRMRYVIRPVASLQKLAQVFDLAGAQLPQRLTRHDRCFAELARRFPTDRSLMLAAEDQGRIIGGALAFRTDPASPACGVTLRLLGLAPTHRGKGLGRRLLEEVEAAAIRLGTSEISLGASDQERGFYLHMGYADRARLRKQLLLSSAAHPRAEERRRDLDRLRQRRQRRLAARQP